MVYAYKNIDFTMNVNGMGDSYKGLASSVKKEKIVENFTGCI